MALPERRHFDIESAAKYLGCSVSDLRYYLDEGMLRLAFPTTELWAVDTILVFSGGFTGGEWRFMQDDSELEEYIPPLDDDEIDMNSYYEFEMTGSGSRHSDHWSFEGEKSKDLMKQAKAILQSDGRDGLEDGGWEYEDTEWFVYGGVELIKD